jgi:hypothetical protein
LQFSGDCGRTLDALSTHYNQGIAIGETDMDRIVRLTAIGIAALYGMHPSSNQYKGMGILLQALFPGAPSTIEHRAPNTNAVRADKKRKRHTSSHLRYNLFAQKVFLQSLPFLMGL